MTYYTILFQYSLYENNLQYMLGPQTGINVKDTHNISQYRNIYEYLLERLYLLMDRYQIPYPDFIVIYLKELNIDDKLKLGQFSSLKLTKGVIPIYLTKKNFSPNILPLSLNDKYFGSLLQADLRLEYLAKIINSLLKNTNPLESLNTSSGRTAFKLNKYSLF
jgi:hypothetical protein